MLPYKLLAFPLIAFLLSACNQASNVSTDKPTARPVLISTETHAEGPPAIDLLSHQKNYENLLTNISMAKSNISNSNNTAAEKIEQGKTLFSNMLVDSIFHYWYGTTWDFNGHTATPRNGEIACGYFVSTTVRHMGVQLNRYKIAQQAALVIVEKLCDNSSIKKFSTIEQLTDYLHTARNNEIFIVGLDYHVGFILKRDDKHYFIHSDYIGREGVKKEILTESMAMGSSNLFVIGNLSGHEEMIRNWIK